MFYGSKHLIMSKNKIHFFRKDVSRIKELYANIIIKCIAIANIESLLY